MRAARRSCDATHRSSCLAARGDAPDPLQGNTDNSGVSEWLHQISERVHRRESTHSDVVLGLQNSLSTSVVSEAGPVSASRQQRLVDVTGDACRAYHLVRDFKHRPPKRVFWPSVIR